MAPTPRERVSKVKGQKSGLPNVVSRSRSSSPEFVCEIPGKRKTRGNPRPKKPSKKKNKLLHYPAERGSSQGSIQISEFVEKKDANLDPIFLLQPISSDVVTDLTRTVEFVLNSNHVGSGDDNEEKISSDSGCPSKIKKISPLLMKLTTTTGENCPEMNQVTNSLPSCLSPFIALDDTLEVPPLVLILDLNREETTKNLAPLPMLDFEKAAKADGVGEADGIDLIELLDWGGFEDEILNMDASDEEFSSRFFGSVRLSNF